MNPASVTHDPVHGGAQQLAVRCDPDAAAGRRGVGRHRPECRVEQWLAPALEVEVVHHRQVWQQSPPQVGGQVACTPAVSQH
jgi:hypothetical protein